MGLFRFKRFELSDAGCGMKISTDGVLLGAWALQECKSKEMIGPFHIVDAGTGSGLIALLLAQRFEDAHITGVEIDPEAAHTAAINFQSSPWSANLQTVAGDFKALEGQFDAIVSNPPYFYATELTSPDCQRRLARHENTLTLSHLISVASRVLRCGGYLSMVLPCGRDKELAFLSALHHFSLSRRTEVVTVEGKQPKRVLYELRKAPFSGPCVSNRLCIRQSDGSFSPEYLSLVKDFYLWL